MATETAKFGQPPAEQVGPSDCSTDEIAPSAPPPPDTVRHDPVVRGTLIALTVLAVVYALAVGKQILMPVFAASLLASACTPAQAVLRRLGIPRAMAAALLLAASLGSFSYAAFLISQPALVWVERAPVALRRLEAKAKGIQESVKGVAEATEKATALAKGQSGEERAQPVEVVGDRPGDLLLGQTLSVLFLAIATLVLLFFLLLDGEEFLFKIVGLIPAVKGKMNAICLVQDVRKAVAHYLLTVSSINLVLAVITGLAMWLLGMPNPLLWGVVGGLFNFAPYLGAITTAGILTIVATMQFSDPWQIAAPPLVFLCLTGIEGNFITPWILGRRFALNPVAVFVSIIFWGWIWGIPGALMATPLLATLKIASDRIKALEPLAAFLGD